ncbi:MAG: hypothetical protein ABI759_00430 [Candidatus Solibacter sp.]
MLLKFAILAAVVCTAAAQPPITGDINFYGLRKLTPDKVVETLDLKTGAPLPPSRGDMEEKLELLPGVAAARVEAVCCDGKSVILFIGIEERGAPHFGVRPSPAGTAALPEAIMAAYQEYVGAVERAAQFGNAAEDLTAGESRMADPAARRVQEQFASLAVDNLATLRDVLRTGAEPEERAVAAAVIAYAPKKDQVIKDLQFAMQDAEPAVRANAVRAMMAIAVLAQKRPELNLKIEPTWMVEMLNSIVLGDRQQAALALVTLTEQNGKAGTTAALNLIRDRALPSLVDMARWKTLRYALPAFLLVGRTAGISDVDLQAQWQQGDRETAIRKATLPAPKPRAGK